MFENSWVLGAFDSVPSPVLSGRISGTDHRLPRFPHPPHAVITACELSPFLGPTVTALAQATEGPSAASQLCPCVRPAPFSPPSTLHSGPSRRVMRSGRSPSPPTSAPHLHPCLKAPGPSLLIFHDLGSLPPTASLSLCLLSEQLSKALPVTVPPHGPGTPARMQSHGARDPPLGLTVELSQ